MELYNNGDKTDKLKGTMFDTRLCKELQDYFKDRKKLAKCFDPNSKENKEINNLFKSNGYDPVALNESYRKMTPTMIRTSFGVEQKIISGISESFDADKVMASKQTTRWMGNAGNSPLISGHMILNDCLTKGLGPSLDHDPLWSSEENATKLKVNEAKPE